MLPSSALHKNLLWKNTRPKAAKMPNKTKYLTICATDFSVEESGVFFRSYSTVMFNLLLYL